ELRKLLDVREIAREQNYAADERRLKPLAFVRGDGLAAQVDHQRTQRHGVSQLTVKQCPRPSPRERGRTAPSGRRSPFGYSRSIPAHPLAPNPARHGYRCSGAL